MAVDELRSKLEGEVDYYRRFARAYQEVSVERGARLRRLEPLVEAARAVIAARYETRLTTEESVDLSFALDELENVLDEVEKR